jgi:hypothetical protein
MLNGADLEGKLRDKIWVERVMNIPSLSNIISIKSSLKIPFELLYGEKPTFHNNFKICGEVGVVTTKDKIQWRCIEELKDEGKITMIQPHLLTCLIKDFEKEIERKRKLLIPGTPSFKIQRSKINMDVLDTLSQRKYRFGVSMLLYLIKYSQPDISNTVQELLKCMDSVTWRDYIDLLRVIEFVIDTKTFNLKQLRLDNNLGWDLKIYCDSDWAGDPETRVRVTGFIIYLMNVPICWRSKSQK